ncbi:MAG: epimerase [Candidatus Sungbacteria bacterium RIFCSPLOWO2_01_FULL_59_16]|uniref:Epimerase n=1 Tax=Candidatus Sungbacteria bacterium RIFCSPLOWO2_01_FULL_59_16 TaxID=1802280 RepID=A0A1G2L9W1_9BACT|nr:MAG: epimerase [Candidatus Sungbacteria bacterium RIFCSPLOWO2_01_FULL_59_16]
MATTQKKSKSILITGGAGFIGSNTLLYLYPRYPQYDYTVLDALTYAGDIKNIPQEIHKSKNFRFIYGDVRNAKLIDHLVSKVNNVIHFAAETHVARSIYDDSNFFTTDVLGTQCIANAVLNHRKNIERFIHISTSEVYGTAQTRVMAEDHPLVPASPYAAAKAGADRLVEAYYLTYRIPAVIIRPFNQYGPRQHLEKLIPRFITSCLMGEPLTVHGTGKSQRDFTYVEDLARAIDTVLHAPREKVEGHIFNVGAGESHSIGEIARTVLRLMNNKSEKKKIVYSESILNIGERPGQVYRHTASNDKIKKVLGWQPRVTFADGLARTIAWYSSNEDWWRDKIWMRHVPIEMGEGKIELH